MATKTCPGCGKQVPAIARRCDNCGFMARERASGDKERLTARGVWSYLWSSMSAESRFLFGIFGTGFLILIPVILFILHAGAGDPPEGDQFSAHTAADAPAPSPPPAAPPAPDFQPPPGSVTLYKYTPAPSPAATTAAPAPSQPVTITDDVREYAAKMLPITDELAESMRQAGALCGQLGSDPYLIQNGDWKLGMGAALGTMKGAADQIRQIQPVPPAMGRVHSLSLQMAGELDGCATECARGIDRLDSDLIASATARLDRISILSGQITTEINAGSGR